MCRMSQMLSILFWKETLSPNYQANLYELAGKYLLEMRLFQDTHRIANKKVVTAKDFSEVAALARYLEQIGHQRSRLYGAY